MYACMHVYMYVCMYACMCIFFPVALQPEVDQAFLIIEASRLHSDTPHSVELLRTSGQSESEISLPDKTQTQHSKKTDIFAPGGIRTLQASERQ